MGELIHFSIYRRSARYYVVALVDRPGVDWASVPDVVPVEPTIESIVAAFRQLEPRVRTAYAENPRSATDDEFSYRHWERMGAKSYGQFVRGTSICDVHLWPNQIEIWYMIPDIKLFTSIGEHPDATLPPDAAYEDIARAVLDIFARYPPPPGDKQPAPKRPRKRAATKP